MDLVPSPMGEARWSGHSKAPCLVSSRRPCQFEICLAACSPVSFVTEKPGQPSSFWSRASAVHLRLAHSPRIRPFPPSFADPLFTGNNPQEIASDGGGSPEVRLRLFGWSNFFWCLPCFSSILFFVAFPALRGNFGSLSLLP